MTPISQFDLDAMKSRTERARNPVKAAAQDAAKAEKFAAGQERELSRQFCADLTRRGIPHIVARTDRKSTVREGWPDVTAMYGIIDGQSLTDAAHGARVCCVELKVAGGALSEAQRRCHEDLTAAGIPVATCYNLKEAIDFVKEHLKL
jgi:hypothetical protein